MADAEVSLKHSFQSAKADGADTTKVRATPWNANHPFASGAIGDLLYYDSGSTTGAKWLPDVAVGQVLVSGGVGVKPAWSATPSLTSLTLSTPLAATSGGTGLSSFAVGDLLYASTTTAVAKLADVAAGSVLVSGGVSTAPAWSATPTLTGVRVSGTASIGTVTPIATASLTLEGGGVAFTSDATYDIGLAGRRPAIVRCATALEVGGGGFSASTGTVRLNNNSTGIRFRNAANSGDIVGLTVDSSDVVTIGDNSFNTKIKGPSVQFGAALIAMGGGSSATLGTIGGSGPTVAGQNTWKGFLDSTGASFWVPVWK
jgi:hypothetical protein